jgi:hypothetical protein
MHTLDNDVVTSMTLDFSFSDQLAFEPDFDGEVVEEGVVNLRRFHRNSNLT